MSGIGLRETKEDSVHKGSPWSFYSDTVGTGLCLQFVTSQYKRDQWHIDLKPLFASLRKLSQLVPCKQFQFI